MIVSLNLTAERAWSTAAAKKDALAQSGKTKLRHSELSRLNKAVKWARALEFLCLSVPEASSCPATALEASAYSSCMAGQQLLEREQWAGAVAEFSRARGIYEELSRAGGLEQKELFQERLTSAVLPSLRFCKYNLAGGQHQEEGEAEDMDPALLAKLQALRARSGVDTEDEAAAPGEEKKGRAGVVWCGLRVDAPEELQGCLLEVEVALSALATAGSEVSPPALEACLSSLDAALHRLSDTRAKGNTASTSSQASLQHLHSYLQFRQMACFSLRNLQLATQSSGLGGSGSGSSSQWARAQEKARLFQQLGQTAAEMSTLVEAAAAASRAQGQEGEGEGEEEDVLSLRLRSEQSVYRACRLVALADCYALAPVETVQCGSDSSTPDAEAKRELLGKAGALLDLADEFMSSTGRCCFMV